MDLLDKLRAAARRASALEALLAQPVGPPFSEVSAGEAAVNGRPVLMFGSNNYLGLSHHPEVKAAAAAALSQYGTGTTGSRVASGTLSLHEELEAAFADLYTMSQSIVFTTGYQTNLAVISALCGVQDQLILDADSHASLHDAAKFAGSQVFLFRHNSATDLAAKLQRLPDGDTNRLVVVEGLYSIQGDVAPLREIADVCTQHRAYLLIDEAHSFGVFGERGLGCADAQDVLSRVDFLVGTFSKSLGGVGGFCVSRHAELGALRYVARPYIFTASGSAANAAGVLAALRIATTDRSYRLRLWTNIEKLRGGLQRCGYVIGDVASPIIPIVIGAEEPTLRVWQALLDAGVYTNVVLPPVCRADRCLLRVSACAAHSDHHLDRGLEIFERVGRACNVTHATVGQAGTPGPPVSPRHERG